MRDFTARVFAHAILAGPRPVQKLIGNKYHIGADMTVMGTSQQSTANATASQT